MAEKNTRATGQAGNPTLSPKQTICIGVEEFIQGSKGIADRLAIFDAEEKTALDLAALALFDLINAGALIVSDQTEPAKAKQAVALFGVLYELQDVLNGSTAKDLPRVVSRLLDVAERGAA